MCEGAELIFKSEYKVSRYHDMKSLQTYCKIKTLQARVETSPGVAQPLPPTSIPKKPGPGDGGDDGGVGGEDGGDNVASLLPQKIIYKKHASYVFTVAGGISDNNITMIFLTRGLTGSAA